MGSPLDYISTEGFRKKLITRNLVPYAKSPTKVTPPTTYEIIQSDFSVVDSPDGLIDTTFYADKQYPLNKWGNDGGYQLVPDISGNLNTVSNKGEYGPGQQDANLIDEAQIASKIGFGAIAPAWIPLNAFGNGGLEQYDAGVYITTPDTISSSIPGGVRQLYNNQPYPTTFNPSSYTPLSILLNPNPTGSNGLLSQDSFIARLGARTLKREFEERIGRAIVRETIGRANFLNINSSTNVVNILTGRVPLIEPNYQITVPANPITAAADFGLRLGGSLLPFSLIPGSYFDPNINPGQPTTIGQALLANPLAALGNLTNKLLGAGKTGSQIFYNNTGAGQKSILWKNINYNRYKPNYDRTLLDRLGGAIVGTETNNANFYIGSTTSDPSRVFSPSRALPVDAFGNEQQSPVYGPHELAQLYEGPSKEIRLGANGPTYSNGGGIEGGFTWVSPKYKGNAGKKVGVGGVILDQDEDFKPSSYNTTESTERTFKEGSILDDTQRIINSQPEGGKRLQHVGNAIDQVSKVFHDGYKELTKGSRVIQYTGAIGQEVGTEYCRVFTKDVPYLQYNDLQKTDGIVTEGRRFSYSVLDKTYNLNIAPNKQEGGQDSTNLIGTFNNAYAKKYMFSIENLAWATSNTPGFSVADLPVCERGPNGGRVMWFPPYGLTFNETVQANWQPNEFIGRPEPIYTYKNTTRTGSLTWKIVVDHPSVLNVIVNKVLANETNKVRVDSILESFFAGCRKYDLYELAKKYYTISPNDLFDIQQAISSKELTREQLEYTISTIKTTPELSSDTGAGGSPESTLKTFENVGFYFNNDRPLEFNQPFTPLYDDYISKKGDYQKLSPTTAEQTSSFFDSVVISNKQKLDTLIDALDKEFTNSKNAEGNIEGTVTITIDSSTSPAAKQAYNNILSAKRINSAAIFITGNTKMKQYVDTKKLIVKIGEGRGENTQVMKFDEKTKTFVPGSSVSCGDNDGNSQALNKEIYTTNAMACRRAYISNIQSTLKAPNVVPPPKETTVITQGTVTKTETVPVIEEKIVNKDNISKRVLRSLLSECDYFETIKEETPMVYDNLRDKLKFFQPAFHSITPEGLNSRLTFLQQCMRPGDTIPTIKTINGAATPVYNDATNTSFGAPPVLVLRVGDFYNTKIIPTSLGIQYENLDINPEGIGVQPMIANITLGFNFVGGSGLKESVDKLQNALTFNYYANTEIYDDRADSTDLSYKVIDAEFLKLAPSNVGPPTLNQTTPNNGQSNDKPIGTVTSNVITETGQTGTINYSIFMDKVVTETQSYFTNVVNKNRETVNQYNNAVRQQWMMERVYTEGKFTIEKDKEAILFGKSYNLEKRTDDLFAQLVKDIKDGDEGFVTFISDNSKDFSNKVIRQVKENYSNFVKNKRSSFQSAITNITNSMVAVQQSYIGYIGRINTITYSVNPDTGTDGYQQSNGKVISYILYPTTEVDASSAPATNTLVELENDVKKINSGITEFNTIVETEQEFTYSGKKYKGTLVLPLPYKLPSGEKVFVPFSENALFENDIFRNVYMIVSDDVTDAKKYETFKNAVIGNILGNAGLIGKGADNISEVFDAYWDKIAKPAFVEENTITKEFINFMEKERLKDFLIYTPFTLKKKRNFEYDTEGANTDAQKELIKGLGWIENQNTKNKTWNDEKPANVFISKAKLS